jgi:phthiodiolone/phenolphthiodiolone dimycocerosates ketoreductase
MRVLLAPSHDEAHRRLNSNALRLGALVVPASVWERAGAEHPFGPGYRGVADYIPSRLEPEEVRRLMGEVPFDVLHLAFDHGTPDQLAARALSYRSVGLRHVVIQNLAPLVDPRWTVWSFRALAGLIRTLRRS